MLFIKKMFVLFNLLFVLALPRFLKIAIQELYRILKFWKFKCFEWRNQQTICIDQFHDDFHTWSFSILSFSRFQHCSCQNEDFTIHLRIWSLNMTWCQIVEWFRFQHFLAKVDCPLHRTLTKCSCFNNLTSNHV